MASLWQKKFWIKKRIMEKIKNHATMLLVSYFLAVVITKKWTWIFIQGTRPAQGITRYVQKIWLSNQLKFRCLTNTFFQIFNITMNIWKKVKKMIGPTISILPDVPVPQDFRPS